MAVSRLMTSAAGSTQVVFDPSESRPLNHEPAVARQDRSRMVRRASNERSAVLRMETPIATGPARRSDDDVRKQRAFAGPPA